MYMYMIDQSERQLRGKGRPLHHMTMTYMYIYMYINTKIGYPVHQGRDTLKL